MKGLAGSSYFANLMLTYNQCPLLQTIPSMFPANGSKYKHLFFDLDHTLWDFEANARLTLQTLYEDLQLKSRSV